MTALKPIKGWKSLIARLNEMIAGINARTISVPLGGGIDLQETTSGTHIALSSSHVLPPGTTSTIGSGGGGGGGSTDLSALSARVAALEAILSTSGWMSVDVMSASCVRTTINVLTKP
jgi:hypothetical protein